MPGFRSTRERFIPAARNDAAAKASRATSLVMFTVVSALAAAQAGAQTTIPVRTVRAAEATSIDTVTFLYGVRELSGGGVLVNDAGSRRLLLFDATLAHARVVADSASASKTPYGKNSTGIIPYRGDSTILVDAASRAFIVIDADGRMARIMSPPRSSNVGSLANPGFGWPGFDDKERLIYRSNLMPTFRPPEAGKPFVMPDIPDSAPILRSDFDKRYADTLGWVTIPKMKASSTPVAGGGVVLRPLINPISFIDDWAMLPDGTVAVLRGRDYHIDWISPTGARRSSAKMPFDWRKLSDEDKVALIDSTKAALKRQMAGVATGGAAGGGMAGHSMTFVRVDTADGGPAPRAGAVPQPVIQPPEVVPVSDIPDYMPPVMRSGNMKADLSGNVWILPATSSQAKGGLLYDVVNRQGELFQRVQLPAGRALAGFGARGAIYLTWRDATGTHLERSRVPTSDNVGASSK